MGVNPNDPVIMDRTKLESEIHSLRKVVALVNKKHPNELSMICRQLTELEIEAIDRAVVETKTFSVAR